MLFFKAENFFERGLEISMEEDIMIYDALYIALAEALNTSFTQLTKGNTTLPKIMWG